MSRTARQAKETDKIKAFLESYKTLQKRIDKTEKRIEYLELTVGDPRGPDYSGMPKGGGSGSSKQERDYIKKEELLEKLGDMNARENSLREKIEGLIECMKKPEEQMVIEMHYLDGVSWPAISAALYGEEPDYDEKERRYLKRTFKRHGSALQSLARIYRAQDA